MNWRKRKEHDNGFYDGDTLLVAVAVCKDYKHPEKGCQWEFHVIVITCDEDYFSLRRPDGESWYDWGWSDIEYFVPIKEVMEGLPPCPSN